jgi:hypothetical protein
MYFALLLRVAVCGLKDTSDLVGVGGKKKAERAAWWSKRAARTELTRATVLALFTSFRECRV